MMENDDRRRPSFRFVVATRRKSDDEELPIVKFLKRINVHDEYKIDLNVVFENKRGLSSVYNGYIEDEKTRTAGDGAHDFLVFVHDDIWIGDVFLFEKIISASKYFDVIGVCGGKGWESYGDGNLPIIWTHASRGKGLSGFMAHAADESQSRVKHEITYNGRSIFSTNYGNSPSRTLTLDGCFICFTRNAVKSGLTFDEAFKFHFYDMDVCFSAFLKNIKVGTAPVLLTHESLGESVSQPQFMESQKMFMKKWFQKS